MPVRESVGRSLNKIKSTLELAIARNYSAADNVIERSSLAANAEVTVESGILDESVKEIN